jgi:hypothetical protein
MQQMRKEDEVWVGAYSVAMAMIVLGETINRGNGASTREPGTVDAMDENAKLVADRVQKTIEERAALAASTKEQRK